MTTVLDELPMVDGWVDVPLRAIAIKVSEPGYGHLQPLSVYLEAGVVPRSSRDDNHNQLGENIEKYQRVLPDDLVFNKLRTWQGGFGISRDKGIVSPAYIIARPIPGAINPRFLGYLLKSAPYLAELTRLSKWMPPSQFDISWESIRDLRLRIPSLDKQRRIADYLDGQIAVVNNLIQNRRDQIVIAREISITDLFLDLQRHNTAGPIYQLPWLDFRVDRKIQFGRLFEVSLGKMLQTEPKSDEDLFLPYLNSASVNDFLSNPDKRMWVNPKEFKNCQVLPGDLIVIEGGDVGRSKFYDGEPSIIQNSLHRVRPFSGNSLNYAHAVLNAVRHSGYFGIICNVATIRHLTLEKLSELPIPFYEPDVQEKIGRAHLENSEGLLEKLSLLSDSITKLEEYKATLITAAVTGTFDVTTGRSVA